MTWAAEDRSAGDSSSQSEKGETAESLKGTEHT